MPRPRLPKTAGPTPSRTDLDNDEYVVRISSQFDRYLPAGPVNIWVYADSYDKKRSTKGLIDELTETNNQYHYPTFTVKPGRILPADADQQLTAAGPAASGAPRCRRRTNRRETCQERKEEANVYAID